MRDHDLDAALAAFEGARRDRTQANVVAAARQGTPDDVPDAPPGRAFTADELARHLSWAEALG